MDAESENTVISELDRLGYSPVAIENKDKKEMSVAGLLDQARSRNTEPQQIALLLPLEGPYREASEAIRDGFLAAWFAGSGHLPRINIYNADSLNIVSSYRQAIEDGVYYRATGVILSDIIKEKDEERDLFDDPMQIEKIRAVGRVIDNINASYGKHTIHIASTGSVPEKIEHPRNDLTWRKTALLNGETFRRRIGISAQHVVSARQDEQTEHDLRDDQSVQHLFKLPVTGKRHLEHSCTLFNNSLLFVCHSSILCAFPRSRACRCRSLPLLDPLKSRHPWLSLAVSLLRPIPRYGPISNNDND